LNLGCSLYEVVYLVDFRNFFFINENGILMVAKFASPQLAVLAHHGLQNALAVKHTVALFTENWVTSGHGACVLEAGQGNLEDIGVGLDDVFVGATLFLFASLALEFNSFVLAIFTVGQVELTIKVI
jgi:hypothetical protein